MTSVKLSINCGCGFRTNSGGRGFDYGKPEEALEEAVRHSEKTGHCLTILGEIRPKAIKEETNAGR